MPSGQTFQLPKKTSKEWPQTRIAAREAAKKLAAEVPAPKKSHASGKKDRVDRKEGQQPEDAKAPKASSLPKTICVQAVASREAEIEVIDRLITIYGGKWTSAPSLSKKVLKKVNQMGV